MMVRNTRTGRVAEVLSQDDKLVRIRFQENGKEQSMTISTYKRWWKKCEDVAEPEKSVDNDDVCGDGTPLAEVGKEIAEQAKQKAEKSTVEQAAKKVLKNANPEKAHKIAEEKKAKEKKSREKFDVEGKVDEIKKLIKGTEYEFRGYYEKKGIVLRHKSTRGLTIRVYIGVDKMVFELTAKQILDGVEPDRVRNLRYSKSYDIDYSQQEKLVEYLNKVTYNNTKSKKGDK